MSPTSRATTALRFAASLFALAAVGFAPAWGQYAALPHASGNGFQPLLIPTQNEPLVLPQPIRIPTAILPSQPQGGPVQYQFDETPVAKPAAQVAQPLQYGLPPAAPALPQASAAPYQANGAQHQVSPAQQQVMFWERQGQPLRLLPLQPAANPQQGYGQAIYPQVVYPQAIYPQVIPQQPTYPQVIYPQAVYPQAVYPQANYPQANYPQPVHPDAAPLQPAAPVQPATRRQLQPIPEFVSGKGALEGYKQAAQIAKAQMGTGHIVALIDLSEQRMTVSINGKPWYDWPVSTGRKGYRTPTGTWGVQRMHRHYKSRTYDNAPMPHSIFFHGPYAIHGTNSVKRLGRTASHGCVRLHPKNAAMLYTLAEVFGKDWMTVKVQS